MKALIISQRENLWQGFATAFAAKDCEPCIVASMDAAVAAIRESAPRLVIMDAVSLFSADAAANLQESRAALMSILMANAMVNTAVVSAMDEEEAHDALEGLGVMAMLGAEPDAAALDIVFDALEQM
ncbi:MAG: hypothetical protein R3Y11_06185 [Pseudomonadota bacterium]